MSRKANVANGRKAREQRKKIALDNAIESKDPQTQLEILDARLGVGVGAAKERERLAKQVKS